MWIKSDTVWINLSNATHMEVSEHQGTRQLEINHGSYTTKIRGYTTEANTTIDTILKWAENDQVNK